MDEIEMGCNTAFGVWLEELGGIRVYGEDHITG